MPRPLRSSFASPFLAGLLVLLLSPHCLAEQNLYSQLRTVNSEWLRQPDANAIVSGEHFFSGEVDLVAGHLQRVEALLRSRDLARLTLEQRHARERNLDLLHGYWLAGKFPQNDYSPKRIPVFIDPHGTPCAVGYLMIQGGENEFAESVHVQQNNIYIREITDQTFFRWAERSGLSVDELALIQPSYGYEMYWDDLGMDTASSIHTLTIDAANVYVGGDFQQVTGLDNLNNIAVWRQKGGWSRLGSGVDGSVLASVLYKDQLYVAGKFSKAGGSPAANIARWDESNWMPLGDGLNDTVHALYVHDGYLYAGGSFTGDDGTHTPYLSRWNGTGWERIPGAIDGPVHALVVHDEDLHIGGNFLLAGDAEPLNVAHWNGERWEPTGGGLLGTVTELESFKGQLFAGGPFYTSGGDSLFGLARFDGKEWTDLSTMLRAWGDDSSTVVLDLDVLHAIRSTNDKDSQLVASVRTNGYSQVISYRSNDATEPGSLFPDMFDGSVNVLKSWGRRLFVGGDYNSIRWNEISALTYTTFSISGVESPRGTETVHLAPMPNPARERIMFLPAGGNSSRSFTLRMVDLRGVEVARITGNTEQGTMIDTRDIARGVYLYRISVDGMADQNGTVVLE